MLLLPVPLKERLRPQHILLKQANVQLARSVMDFAPIKNIVAVTMAIAVAVSNTATPPNYVPMKEQPTTGQPTMVMKKEHVVVSV